MNPALRIVACVFLVLTAAALHFGLYEWQSVGEYDQRVIFSFLRHRTEVNYLTAVSAGVAIPLALLGASAIMASTCYRGPK